MDWCEGGAYLYGLPWIFPGVPLYFSGPLGGIQDGLAALCPAPMHQQWRCVCLCWSIAGRMYIRISNDPDSKVHVANMGPIWGRQDPGGLHVGPMNFAIWGSNGATRERVKMGVTVLCNTLKQHGFYYTVAWWGICAMINWKIAGGGDGVSPFWRPTITWTIVIPYTDQVFEKLNLDNTMSCSRRCIWNCRLWVLSWPQS